jgi:hypothetical protein
MMQQVAQGRSNFPLLLGQESRGQPTPITTKPTLQTGRVVYPTFGSLVEDIMKKRGNVKTTYHHALQHHHGHKKPDQCTRNPLRIQPAAAEGRQVRIYCSCHVIPEEKRKQDIDVKCPWQLLHGEQHTGHNSRETEK